MGVAVEFLEGAYTVGQWNRLDAPRVCRECTARHRDAGEPYQCSVCRLWFSEEAFPTKHRRNANSFYRVCHACEVRKPCYKCNIKKAECEYTASAWKSRHADRRICTACAGTKKAKGYWTCAACQRSVSQLNFTTWHRRRHAGQDGTQVCDECYRANALKYIAAQARSRLQERRIKMRRRAILEEVRREINIIVHARSRPPRPQETNKPSPERSTGIKEETTANMTHVQPSIAARSRPADNRKRPRKNSRDIHSKETTAAPPKKHRSIPTPVRDETRPACCNTTRTRP